MAVDWLSVPMVTLLTLLISVGVSLLYAGLGRLVVSRKRLRALRAELKEFEKLVKKAEKVKDERKRLRLERKFKKKETRYRQLLSALQWEHTKMMAVMFLVFSIVIFVLAPYFGRRVVAYFPIGNIPLIFIFWYGLCAMALGILIQRALGIKWTE